MVFSSKAPGPTVDARVQYSLRLMGKVSTAAGPVVKVHDGQSLDEVKKLIGKLFKVDPAKAGKITYEEPPVRAHSGHICCHKEPQV